MPRDYAQHLDPAGAASLPPPATHLPPPPPPSAGASMLGPGLIAEIRRIGVEGFRCGYSAGIDQLVEPITATWLASESGLPEDRCRALLLELRDTLAEAASRD